MEGRRPQLDLRAKGAVGGRPGALFVSPDASQLYVFDQVEPRVSVIGIARWEIAGTINLAPAVASVPFFLAGFEGSIFLGGTTSEIAILGPASRGCRGAIPCGGDACDLGYLPETRQAVLTVASGDGGVLQFLEFNPDRTIAAVALPRSPVRGTLVMLPKRGLGAVAMRGADGFSVALFDCVPGSDVAAIRLEGDVRSIAFEPEGRYLYAACHGTSSLAVIDVAEQRVVERVLMAGEPIHVAADAVGRRIWALCEKVGHAAFVDPRDHSVCKRTQLGVSGGRARVAFSPEGRLAAVPEPGNGSLALLESGGMGTHYGEIVDRLELGRDVGGAVWSPLGEEVYVAAPDTGAVLALAVDRGDEVIKDTDLYLMDQLLRQEDPAGWKNPLFPP